MNKIKYGLKIASNKLFLSILVFTMVATVSLAAGGLVYAAADDDACAAINGTMKSGVCVTDGPSVNDAITAVINTLSVIVGIVAVIMLIFGGFKYVTSGGDANAAKSARSTIMYALIGAAVAAISQALVQFVLTKV